MNISLYEEFPTGENLNKIKLIDFPTSLIIAAKSLKEFYSLINSIKKYNNKNIKEIIYWPVLDKEEGYWFSAFSKNSALKRITEELKQNKKPLTIMWDAELPIKPLLIFKQSLNFQNKKYNIKILTSEYPLESKFFRNLLFNLFLVSLDPKIYKSKKIAMLYTSFLKNHLDIENFLEKQIKIGKKYLIKFSN